MENDVTSVTSVTGRSGRQPVSRNSVSIKGQLRLRVNRAWMLMLHMRSLCMSSGGRWMIQSECLLWLISPGDGEHVCTHLPATLKSGSVRDWNHRVNTCALCGDRSTASTARSADDLRGVDLVTLWCGGCGTLSKMVVKQLLEYIRIPVIKH